MIPYKPPEVKQKTTKDIKLKSIPSIEFIFTLNSVCEGSQNTYDSKNHVLTINDINHFQNAVQSKLGRSLKSFQRQLQMLGFKTRRQKYTIYQSQKEVINVPKIYKWKGKKQLLIDQQLNNIQRGLKERRFQMQQTRKIINSHKNCIDNQIQSVIFSLAVDFSSQKVHDKLAQVLIKTRTAVNQSQIYLRKMINKISGTLGNELELYKLLIYKEGNSDKRINQKQDDGEGANDGHNSQDSRPQAINQQEEDSKKSLVSIQMEHNANNQLEQAQKRE